MPEYEKIVIDAGKKMSKLSLTVSTWGNISARDPKTGNIYLTPSGMDYDNCTEDDIVVFNAEGKRIKGRRKPSIEKDIHLLIFQRNDYVNAVIHTHALYSTVLAAAHISLPVITEEFAQTIGSEAVCSEYAIPGTPLLAENVSRVVENGHRAVLLPSHGALCVGESMDIAFKACGVLEKAAEVYIKVKSMGLEPRIIPDDEVGHMFRFFSNNYGQAKK
jgi:L-fuculose-phosphate aldolase